MRWNRSMVNDTSRPSRKWPVSASTATSAMALATKAIVCSLIWVAAWITPTITPMTSTASSGGAPSSSAICRPRTISVRATSGVIVARSEVEAGGERADHQHPAVDQHEQQDLERRRDHHRRQHHHAHRHQHAGDHQVDDHERDIDQERDLERGLELAG